ALSSVNASKDRLMRFTSIHLERPEGIAPLHGIPVQIKLADPTDLVHLDRHRDLDGACPYDLFRPYTAQRRSHHPSSPPRPPLRRAQRRPQDRPTRHLPRCRRRRTLRPRPPGGPRPAQHRRLTPFLGEDARLWSWDQRGHANNSAGNSLTRVIPASVP